MKMLRHIWAVYRARNLEFVRDHGALVWAVVFPVLVVMGMAWVFSGPPQPIFKVGVVGSGPLAAEGFHATPHVKWVPYEKADDALARLRRHQLDFVWQPPDHYWVNSTSPNGAIVEALFVAQVKNAKKEIVEGKPIRYVDWLISGLLGMNMMFSALFGVGYVIVRYRKTGVLKRFKATPLKAFEFLSAQVLSRLTLIAILTSGVYTATNLILKFQMVGSYLDLFVVMLAGAICLISLGLLVACRSASEEFSGGILNAVSWPMMMLSGVWFSMEGAHPWLIKISHAFPLTHVIEAARAIMTEGATLVQVMPHLTVLAFMSALFLVLGSVLFKWN